MLRSYVLGESSRLAPRASIYCIGPPLPVHRQARANVAPRPMGAFYAVYLLNDMPAYIGVEYFLSNFFPRVSLFSSPFGDSVRKRIIAKQCKEESQSNEVSDCPKFE